MTARNLVLGVILAAACCGSSASVAVASPLDSQQYITNWPGTVVSEFNGNEVPFPVSSLSSDLSTSTSAVCADVQSAVSKLFTITSWNACSPGKVELRGKMLGANTLAIKVIFTGLNFNFNVSETTNPKIFVSGNAEVDTTIYFSDAIDGSIVPTNNQYYMSPISISPPQVQFSSVSVTSSNVVANAFGPNLNQVATNIDQSGSQYSSALASTFVLLATQQNPSFHMAAKQLQQAIMTQMFGSNGPDPTANGFFWLAVSIDPSQNLIINFVRDGQSPPTPNSCTQQPAGYASVNVECYSYSSSGTILYDKVDDMYMNRLDLPRPTSRHGTWVLVDDGVHNSWDFPPFRHVVPQFQDNSFQSDPTPPTSAIYQVCAVNLWGGPVCGPDLPITLDLTVTPVTPAGPPQCGPNSHPYRQCQAVQLNSQGAHPNPPPGATR